MHTHTHTYVRVYSMWRHAFQVTVTVSHKEFIKNGIKVLKYPVHIHIQTDINTNCTSRINTVVKTHKCLRRCLVTFSNK